MKNINIPSIIFICLLWIQSFNCQVFQGTRRVHHAWRGTSLLKFRIIAVRMNASTLFSLFTIFHNLLLSSFPFLLHYIDRAPPSFFIESPAVIVYPTTTSSDTGGVVILSCVVFAIPTPNITWTVTNQYGSTSLVQNTSSTTIKTSTLTVSNYTYAVSYLVICNTTENNTGNYSCAGSNGVNATSLTTTSKIFLVTVKGMLLRVHSQTYVYRWAFVDLSFVAAFPSSKVKVKSHILSGEGGDEKVNVECDWLGCSLADARIIMHACPLPLWNTIKLYTHLKSGGQYIAMWRMVHALIDSFYFICDVEFKFFFTV